MREGTEEKEMGCHWAEWSPPERLDLGMSVSLRHKSSRKIYRRFTTFYKWFPSISSQITRREDLEYKPKAISPSSGASHKDHKQLMATVIDSLLGPWAQHMCHSHEPPFLRRRKGKMLYYNPGFTMFRGAILGSDRAH